MPLQLVALRLVTLVFNAGPKHITTATTTSFHKPALRYLRCAQSNTVTILLTITFYLSFKCFFLLFLLFFLLRPRLSKFSLSPSLPPLSLRVPNSHHNASLQCYQHSRSNQHTLCPLERLETRIVMAIRNSRTMLLDFAEFQWLFELESNSIGAPPKSNPNPNTTRFLIPIQTRRQFLIPLHPFHLLSTQVALSFVWLYCPPSCHEREQWCPLYRV